MTIALSHTPESRLRRVEEPVPRKRLGMQDRLRREVMLLERKLLRSTVNGPPSSDKINQERALSRGSLRSREKREEPVIGQMRRNAGEDRAGTQGWRRPRQVAMLPLAGGLLG